MLSTSRMSTNRRDRHRYGAGMDWLPTAGTVAVTTVGLGLTITGILSGASALTWTARKRAGLKADLEILKGLDEDDPARAELQQSISVAARQLAARTAPKPLSA